MKKRICSRLVAGALICSVFGTASVNANTIDMQFSKVDSDGVLNVGGRVELKENNIPINLIIKEKESGNILAIKQTLTDEEGKYAFKVDLETVITNGGDFAYTTIGQVENEESGEFLYYTKNELDGVAKQIEVIKAKVTSEETTYDAALSEIAEVLKDNKKLLSFSKAEMGDFIEMNSARAGKMIYDETITSENLIKYLTEAELIFNIEKSSTADEVKELMAQPELRLSSVSEYADQTDIEKTQLNARLAGSRRTYERFTDFYADVRENIIIVGLYNNRGTTAISNILEKYNNLFNLDTYNKASNDKSAVLKKIDKAIEADQINTFEDIQGILDVYIAKNQKGGSGGGSGGGGGSAPMVPSGSKTDYKPADVVETEETEYSDLESFEWAKEHINKLSGLGIVSGYDDGSYRPQNEVTRAELSKIIYLSLGLSKVGRSMKFDDVRSDAWYADYVNALNSAGIINGTDEKTFNPEGKVTRQDLCTILFRALRYKGFMTKDSEYKNSFSDNDEIKEYALDAVNRLSEAKIISGFEDGSFKPLKSCTRAETAKLISMVYDYMN
ncbi:MAG: S-layer homology domain-containing protein [Clostridia bacterium]|nr:S-layer homology domain-containing protein [Clostridia bacterium]